MLLCFNCKPETRDYLDALVAKGAYRGYAEVIEAAVRNLVLMEELVTETGAIVFGDHGKPVPHPDPSGPATNGLENEKNGTTHKSTPRVKQGTPTANVSDGIQTQIPVVFQLEGLPTTEPKGLADLPSDMWSVGQQIPLDRWMLGQFNRLLPAKVNARALIRMFVDQPKGLEIDSAATTVAGHAAALGDYLRRLDTQFNASRDDALATAFPSAEEGAEKGRTRYANQFVCYQNTKGELSGLMVDLKLINFVAVKRERKIVPTRTAWEFAVLPNPVLDGRLLGSAEKFSAQERTFLVNHILRSVPVEGFAYRVILEAIQQGHSSPDQIDAALKGLLDENRADTLSQSFLASQRSGAISRMSDLGLVERRRDGVRVSYALTNEGQAFLQRAMATQC